MNPTSRSPWRKWMVFWEIAFALACGTMLFIFLNIASAGVLLTVVTAGACFAVLGLAHYLVWGRDMGWRVLRSTRSTDARGRRESVEEWHAEFTLGLTDPERKELEHVLEHSIAQAGLDEKRQATRRELLKKLRMFGA